MAHVNGVFQIECIDERAEIIGDASIAARSEKEHLIFKGICGERPAVTENDGLSFAPIVVIELCAVFGGNRAHRFLHGKLADNERLRHARVRTVSLTSELTSDDTK